MAYSATSLVRIASIAVAMGRSISVHGFGTPDAAATVETSGYFNAARGRLAKGDIIMAAMVIDGTPVLKNYVVTAVPASGNVTIALQTATAG